jgi:5'-nucleotidase
MQATLSESTTVCTRVPWEQIDTVLLDMDGTVLDLHFDNFFWLELVPRRYAQQNRLTLEDAKAQLAPRFAAKQGELEWYCTDYWSRELSLDIAGLKHEMRERVCFLPGAQRFLQTLLDRGKRMFLVTNAHPDSLAVKAAQTSFQRYFAAMISSHRLGAPKESAEFWASLQAELRYDCARTLFIDDSPAVLRWAQRHGIAHIFAVTKPDTTQAARESTEFPAIEGVSELLGSAPGMSV